MKAAPSDRSVPKLRPLRSLYSENAAPGKREAAHVKPMDRKSVFKPYQNAGMLKKNIVVPPPKNVARHTRAGVNIKESTRICRAINAGGGTGKYSHLNGTFLRPSIDVRSFHQKIMERARQLGETLQTEEVKQSKGLNQTIAKLQSTGVCCTPKPSGLSRVYIKLSESKNKSGLLRKGAPSTALSPFEERIIQNETSACLSKVPDINQENILDANNFTHSKILDDTKVKANNDLPCEIVSNAEHLSKKFSSNIEKEAGNSVSDENNGNCALRNILKHCQLYSSNMTNISNAMNALDETFQRAMVGEIGSRLLARFSDYQNGKFQLYKKMKLLEEELEKSVKDEVNIPSKFHDYLATRRNVMKERRDLQEKFENHINQIIENCDREMGEPAKCGKLEDVMEGLLSDGAPPPVESGEPTLRRSQRLSTVSRTSDAEASKSGAILTAAKDCEIKEELVVKRRSKSYDKKRIQSCIYKDLQKSFNLCSPESSF